MSETLGRGGADLLSSGREPREPSRLGRLAGNRTLRMVAAAVVTGGAIVYGAEQHLAATRQVAEQKRVVDELNGFLAASSQKIEAVTKQQSVVEVVVINTDNTICEAVQLGFPPRASTALEVLMTTPPDSLTGVQGKPGDVTMFGFGNQFNVISFGIQRQGQQWAATEYNGVISGNAQCNLTQSSAVIGKPINHDELKQIEQAMNSEIDRLTAAAAANPQQLAN